MSIYAVTDDEQTIRYYHAGDGETACELHKEKFDPAIITVERTSR
jgi:hypothetical protein